MDEKILDEKIKESLLKETDASLRLKKDIWENIETQIKNDNFHKEVKSMRKNRKKSIFTSIGLVAAAIVIAFSLNTNAGKAAVNKIKNLFVPEKVIEQDIEGQKENTKVNLKQSSDYVIYIDENNYKMVKQDGKDKIIPKVKISENLPEVYMEIQHVTDKSPQEMATQIENELRSRFETVENKGIIEKPIKAIFLYARSGLKWNDTVVKYYLVDDKKGGTFVIKQQLFIEATEGHGARFYHMLKEFKVVKTEK